MSDTVNRRSLLVVRVLVALVLLLGLAMAWLSWSPLPDSGHASGPSMRPTAPLPSGGAVGATAETVDIRFQDLVSGIVEMENNPSLRVAPEQARLMKADIERLQEHLALLFIVQVRLNRLLRPDQWSFAWDRRWSDLTKLDVPVPAKFASLPDPIKTVTWATALVEEAAVRKPQASDTPGPYHTPRRNDDELSWFHISQAVILFSARHPELAVTPPQAVQMLRFMRPLSNVTRSIKRAEERLTYRLSPTQSAFILEQKHRKAVREQEGHPILDARSQPSVAQAAEIIKERAAGGR